MCLFDPELFYIWTFFRRKLFCSGGLLWHEVSFMLQYRQFHLSWEMSDYNPVQFWKQVDYTNLWFQIEYIFKNKVGYIM